MSLDAKYKPSEVEARWYEYWLEKGLFNAEILPVTLGSGAKARTVARDEGMRPDTTVEA